MTRLRMAVEIYYIPSEYDECTRISQQPSLPSFVHCVITCRP